MKLESITLEQAQEMLKLYWEEAKEAPQIIWKWTESFRLFRGIAIGAAALIALLALYLVIALFRGGWKRLFANMLVIAVGFASICALLIVAKREVVKALPAEETAVMLSDSEAVAGGRYSLARGVLSGRSVDSNWRLVDNTFTLPVGEDLILQLTGLGRPDQTNRFYIHEVRRNQRGDTGLIMNMIYNTVASDNSGQNATLDASLELWVLPDYDQSRMPWYGEPGTVIPDTQLVEEGSGYGEYTVLDNDGKTVVLSVDCGQIDGGEHVMFLGLSRQIGPDVLCCLVRCAEHKWSYKESENTDILYNPVSRQKDREALQNYAESMMADTKLLRGLSPEERGTILPVTLSDYPAGSSWRNGNFTIPCIELLEMTYADDYVDRQITLIGEMPDGAQGRYTLTNSTYWLIGVYREQNPGKADRYHEWEAVFAEGEEHPDPEMTAFLGAPAVPWEDGWLLNPGPFSGEYDGQYLYYLTVEPLS